MRTYRGRYEGREDEVRSLVRKLGASPALDVLQGGGDLISFTRYAQELMPDEKISVVNGTALRTFDEVLAELALKIIERMIALDAENQALKEEKAKRHRYEEADLAHKRDLAFRLGELLEET